MEAFVEVIRADGTSERFPIEGEQATLGRAGTAGISLPAAAELELEHLLLAPRGREGCWVSTSQGAATPTLMKGKPFNSGMVPWGSELTIGSVKIRISDRRTPTKKEGGINPVLLVASVLVMGLAGWWFLGRQDELLESPEDIDAPNLFVDGGECSGSGDAATNAHNAEYRAHSRGDRYHYDPRDGVAAVRLYEEAASCYREAGDTQKAADMERARDAMKVAVEADYAGRRLRLHHAVQTKDWGKAVIETEALVQLTQHLPEDDPFVSWLRRANRIVAARRDRERSRRNKRN